MKKRRIILSFVISLVATIAIIFFNNNSASANGGNYQSGTPTFLQNKLWTNNYTTQSAKAAQYKAKNTIYNVSKHHFSVKENIIYDGNNTSQTYSAIHVKTKKISNNEYRVKFSINSKKEIKYGTNEKIFTFKIINKDHVKVVNSDGQAYDLYAK